MPRLFEIKDRTGRKIYLTAKGYGHISKHKEMSGKTEHMKEVLINPDIVIRCNVEPDIWYYYKYDKRIKKYLFLSVKYLNGDGFVITGCYTSKIK